MKVSKEELMVTRVKEGASAGKTLAENQKNAAAAPLLGEKTLRQLYALMLRSRMVTEVLARRSEEIGAPGQNEFALGLEATEAATVLDLKAKDTIVPFERLVAVRVVAGESLKSLLRQRRQPAKGTSAAGRVSLNILSTPSNGILRLNMGTGVALAYRLLRRRNVVVAITHGISANEEAYRECLSVAAGQKLPMVFVMVREHSEMLPGSAHELWPDPNVLPTIVVDGNDPVAVYRVAHEAIDHARTGGGPTVIDCRAHWWHADAGSITEDQRQHDPLLHLESYLTHKHYFDAAWKSSLVSEIQREITEAMSKATRTR